VHVAQSGKIFALLGHSLCRLRILRIQSLMLCRFWLDRDYHQSSHANIDNQFLHIQQPAHRCLNPPTMDLGLDESDHICVCGRCFHQRGALLYHQRSCKKTKTRLAGALVKAKDVWTARKRRRLEGENPSQEGAGLAGVMQTHGEGTVGSRVHISLWRFYKPLICPP
jgi:hypothetical protein